jgi:hypothetical protein
MRVRLATVATEARYWAVSVLWPLRKSGNGRNQTPFHRLKFSAISGFDISEHAAMAS